MFQLALFSNTNRYCSLVYVARIPWCLNPYFSLAYIDDCIYAVFCVCAESVIHMARSHLVLLHNCSYKKLRSPSGESRRQAEQVTVKNA